VGDEPVRRAAAGRLAGIVTLGMLAFRRILTDAAIDAAEAASDAAEAAPGT
jgi:hypothetical protein